MNKRTIVLIIMVLIAVPLLTRSCRAENPIVGGWLSVDTVSEFNMGHMSLYLKKDGTGCRPVPANPGYDYDTITYDKVDSFIYWKSFTCKAGREHLMHTPYDKGGLNLDDYTLEERSPYGYSITVTDSTLSLSMLCDCRSPEDFGHETILYKRVTQRDIEAYQKSQIKRLIAGVYDPTQHRGVDLGINRLAKPPVLPEAESNEE